MIFLLLACRPDPAPADDTAPAGYHPPGYDVYNVHGLEAKLQVQACTECHGADLAGGTSTVSCDTCHPTGWRTDCTFCHGGLDGDESGAPPVGIDGSLDSAGAAFPAHAAHTRNTFLHAAFGCVECHTPPTNALSEGHVFIADTTPGIAEVDFTAGRAASATWTGSGCSNVYCHGNGQVPGDIEATATVECGACHAAPTDTAGWTTMSGEHAPHLGRGVTCTECHADTVDAAGTIIDTDRHVNATVDLHLSGDMVYNGTTCTGTCHDEYHFDRAWIHY